MKTNYAKKPDSTPAKAAGSFCACKFAFASMHFAKSRSAENVSSHIDSQKDTFLSVSFSLLVTLVLLLGISFLICGAVPVLNLVLTGVMIVSLRIILYSIIKFQKALPHSILPV